VRPVRCLAKAVGERGAGGVDGGWCEDMKTSGAKKR
jgi:hypothetical protein